MTGHWTPIAGDFITVDFDPQAGREEAGRRPAIVVSEAMYNRAARLAIVCPITNQVKGYPFEVAIPPGGPITGVVLADHVKSIDLRARRARLVAHAPRAVLDATRQLIATILGLSG